MKRILFALLVSVLVLVGFTNRGVVHAANDNSIEILIGYDGSHWESKTPIYTGDNTYGYYDRVPLNIETTHEYL